MEIIEAVEHVNEKQKSIVYDKLISLIGNVKDKTIAVLGLAFKPETDDMLRLWSLLINYWRMVQRFVYSTLLQCRNVNVELVRQ